MASKAPEIPAICIGCGQRGVMAKEIRPAWCRCRGPKFGPYQAPPGHVTCFVFYPPSEIAAIEAADDRARKIRNEYIDARDAGSDAHWTPGGRSRSARSAIYRAWEARFVAARKALQALQADCRHPARYRGCCVRCADMHDKRSHGSYIDYISGRVARCT